MSETPGPPADEEDPRIAPADAFDFLAGGGEMGARIRAHDWSASPLGDPRGWPQSLRSALSICVHSSFPTAIYWGPELRLLYNDAWAPIPAGRHPWALGRPAAEVWVDIWDIVGPQLDQVLATGEGLSTFDYMLPIVREGVARETYWNYSFTPIRGEDGSVVGVFNQGHETTERVLAERRRAAEIGRQRRMFEQAPGFISVLRGPEHRFEFANETFARLFGDRGVVGRTVREAFPDLQGQGFFDWLDQVYATGERFVARRVPMRLDRDDGSGSDQLFLDFIYAPITDEDGAVTGIFCEGHDATEAHVAQERLRELNETLEQRVAERTAELQQAQEALRQSQKLEAMGQLTGGVAHDFNNLLTPIIGSLDMLLRRGVGDDRAQRQINGALQAAERAKTLVQRLLAFARRQPLQPVPVDLGGLVAGMADLVDSTTGPRIRVEVEVEPGLPAALADANQIEMAILNLAVNARDAMPDGGTLTISAACESIDHGHRAGLPAGRYIRLAVTDTGVGMDTETQSRAIEPFFSTKGIGHGTGLGLSMVHGLASQLGGALTIRSRSGLGTSVELWLPIAGRPPAEDRGVREETPRRAGTALLVDDEQLVRMSTADMLSDLGYEVVEAESAEEALRLLDEGLRPEVMITDHLMPGMNGMDLVQQARTRLPDLPVIVVSGYAEDDGIAAGVPCLVKPFRQCDLAAILAGAADVERP